MFYRDLSTTEHEAIAQIADHFDICADIAGTVFYRADNAHKAGLAGTAFDPACSCGLCAFVKDAWDDGATKKTRVTVKLSSETDGFCVACGEAIAFHVDTCRMCEGTKIHRQVLVTAEGPSIEAWADSDQTIEGSTWESMGNDTNTVYTTISNRPNLAEDLRKEGYHLDLSLFVAMTGT